MTEKSQLLTSPPALLQASPTSEWTPRLLQDIIRSPEDTLEKPVSTRASFATDRLHAPYKIAALVEVLSEQGIAADDCLAGSGLDASKIHDAGTLTSARQYAEICQKALILSKDPSTPFQVGKRLHLSAYGMYGYALMSCLSLRDYFTLGVKYHLLATPMLSIDWQEHSHAAIWNFPNEFTFAPSLELRRFLIEQQFAQQITHLEDVAGEACPPTEARFSYAAPPYAEIYSIHLRCPCSFGQARCELHYDSAILDQKPKLAHRLTSSLIQVACDDLIKKAKASTGIAGEVYQILIRSPGVSPNMEDVAQNLNMTSRTLRRRLNDEEVSFSSIVDDVHRVLATEYLRSTRLKVEDIAELVGFSDAANFRRAVRRWTGKSPGELRAEATKTAR